jgi:hypothetical protein
MKIDDMEIEQSDPVDLEKPFCECGWKGELGDCGKEIDSEGWEYPDYMIATCPNCGKAVEY